MYQYKFLKFILYSLISFDIIFYILYVLNPDSSLFYPFFGYTYSIIGLLGATSAFIAASYWGSAKSYIGKFLLFVGMGQLFLFLGQNTCHYIRYIEQVDKCPYPSYAEIFFAGSIFLYIFGAYYLASAMGVFKSINTKIGYKTLSLLVILGMVWFALYKFAQVNELTNFEDFKARVRENTIVCIILELIFPFGAGIYTSIAIFAAFSSVNMSGGKLLKNIIFVLLGFLMQFTGDTVYIWTSGLVSDGFYLTSFIFMSLASLFFIESAVALKNPRVANTSSSNQDGGY